MPARGEGVEEAAGARVRAVVIGASNVTRGIATLAANAEALLGSPLELLVAAGRGRSFGSWSRILLRALPPILECGVWDACARAPRPTHAIITDVGNDLLYGVEPEILLEWVDECAGRLVTMGARVVIARPCLPRLERVNARGYAAVRWLFVPRHRPPPHAEMMRRVRAVVDGLAEIARGRGGALVDPRPEWYGLDPIHLRVRAHAVAWRTMLAPWEDPERGLPDPARGRWWSAGRLAATLPQQGRMAGIPFGREDGPAGEVRAGGTLVRLF